jgi:hypothetical protein
MLDAAGPAIDLNYINGNSYAINGACDTVC